MVRLFGVRIVADSSYYKVERAPYNRDLGWDQKTSTVVYHPSCKDSAEMIHEVAHGVFDNMYIRKTGSMKLEEFPEHHEFRFFGWEYWLAKQCHIEQEWIDSCRDYVVENKEFREYSSMEQLDILVERMAHARDIGLPMTCDPVAIQEALARLRNQDRARTESLDKLALALEYLGR